MRDEEIGNRFIESIIGFMSFVQRIRSYFSVGGETTPYEVVLSKRSRNVRLRISPENGLSVTVPKKFPLREVDKILRDKAKWIFSKMKEVSKAPQLSDGAHLRFLDEILTLRFVYQEGTKCVKPRVERQETLLLISASDFSQSAVKKYIRDWLRKEAVSIFSLRLAELSRRTGIPFVRVSIRAQKTRWGSASLRKTISLNYKLLCTPAAVVDYVMIHELSHLVHMNHSRAFWALVAQYVPNYKELRKWLHAEGKYIQF